MNPARLLAGVVGLAVVIAGVGTLFQALALYDAQIPKLLQAVVATVAGVLGAAALYYFLNMMVEALPRRIGLRLVPYAFLLPAMALLAAFLIFPTAQTVLFSFANSDSTAWVGISNFTQVLTDPLFQDAIFTTLLWLLIVPAFTVSLGLVVAVLADKLGQRGEKFAKLLIFLPMAISMVGAATIWRFVYAFAPEGRPQIGLLNAVWTSLGFNPVSWLQLQTGSVNSMLLMVILVWLQVGFAMVLLSAAVKAVPIDTLEAARMDGAGEFAVFRKIIVPQIRGSLITVYITVLILVLKVFDIVYVSTGGQYGTNVIAVSFFQQIFQFGQNGLAAAIVVILLVAVLPVLFYQVRHFRAEEANR